MLDTITIRQRRQITFPGAALEAVSADVGEKLIVKATSDSIILKPATEDIIATFTAL